MTREECISFYGNELLNISVSVGNVPDYCHILKLLWQNTAYSWQNNRPMFASQPTWPPFCPHDKMASHDD